MSAGNSHRAAGAVAVTATRPVVLVRYRPGAGETARIVHVVPAHPGTQTDMTGVALCGALLRPELVETVTPGQGMPCSLCVLSQASASLPPVPVIGSGAVDATVADCGSQAAAVAYREWGWPVTRRHHQVWLTLEPDTVALIMPVPLSARVSTILRQQHCPALVLAHPDAPEHHVMLAGERYGVALPWPAGMHRSIGTFPLPPTRTANGPVTWAQPPEADALRLCREIDVFTALRDPPT
ncbi:MAG: hypothetical protein DLM61_02185 [Pseudonocardiales bacterium]|nr:MAG: hypothetical protein DLM61_02185 [Pseudonocardiales bacterium]